MIVTQDRIKETSTTAGAGNFTLDGAASGYRAFSSVCVNNDEVTYVIQMQGEWEVGYGKWTTGNILVRSQIISSSNAGAAVVFSAGTKDVFLAESANSVRWLMQDGQTPQLSTSTTLDDEFDGQAGAAINAKWTAVNVGTSTALLDGRGRIVITAQVGAGDNKRLWMQTPPATPWKITTKCNLNNIAAQPLMGLWVRNVASAKLICLGPYMTSAIQTGIFKFTNPTTFSATILTSALFAFGSWYYRVTNDGVNLKFYISCSGTADTDWILLATEALATFIGSVDHVGIGGDSNSAGQNGVGVFDFFRVS